MQRAARKRLRRAVGMLGRAQKAEVARFLPAQE